MFDDSVCYYRYLASLNLEENQFLPSFDESDTESVANSVACPSVRYLPFSAATDPIETFLSESEISNDLLLLSSSKEE